MSKEWIPQLPAEWSHTQVRHLARVFAGGTPDRKNSDYWINGSIPWLNSGAVNQDRIIEPSEFVTDLAASTGATRWVRKGSVVVALAGQGKTKGMAARTEIDATLNQSLAAIEPGPQLHYRFLHYWLKANYRNLRGLAGGELRDGLNLDHIGAVHVPLPPLNEQKLIADYLDRETAKIDVFISDLQVLFHLASEHFSSLRSKVLCQPSSVEKEIDSPSVPLTRVLPHRVDYRGATPTKVDDGIQLVTARNIRPGWIDYESSQEFVSSGDYSQVMSRGLPAIGDILFTMEAPLGNAALVDRTDVALAQRVIKFTPAPGVDPSFMCHVMNSAEFQHQLRELATGSTALGLKASKLHQLQVFVPDIATQERVVRTLDDAWSSVVELQRLVDEATRLASERRAALISAAVTGQIDVTAQDVSVVEQLQDELEVHV